MWVFMRQLFLGVCFKQRAYIIQHGDEAADGEDGDDDDDGDGGGGGRGDGDGDEAIGRRR